MPNEEADPVPELQREIDRTRAAFNDLHQRFETMVGDYVSAAPELADTLIAHAEEFGQEETIERLRANPERFGLHPERDHIATEDMQRIAATMERLIDVSDNLDRLTVERETVLCAQDPSRERVYNSYGREFVMDWEAKKIRHLDRPNDLHPMQVQVVEPRRAPDRKRIADDALRPREQAQPKPTKPRSQGRSQ
jgi:hypothetical protein